MAFEGLERGSMYGAIDERHGQLMQVRSVENSNGRPILPKYQANGFLLSSREDVTVRIFEGEYQNLNPGDQLTVFAIPSNPSSFITSSKLNESKPFIRLGGLTVTWHFPVALIGWFIIAAYFFSTRSDSKRS